MKKIFKWLLFLFALLVLTIFLFLFIGKAPLAKEIKWGVNFSSKYTKLLGLDWQKAYLAMFDDLGAKRIKLITYWDDLEAQQGEYFFNDLDWQTQEAEKRGVEMLLVMGMKTPRWPECHLPQWAINLPKQEQQEAILDLIKSIVLRYQDSSLIRGWQVENEPFFPFGECPWSDKEFVKKEIELVKSLDKQQRPVLISDSGENSFWLKPAQLGDVVGITLYQNVWNHEMKRYIDYPLPPVFYFRKAKLIEKLFQKKVICVELQLEPWGPVLIYDLSLEDQMRTMNLAQFKENIDFARKTGLDEFYTWGNEWWYWLKEKHNQPEIWNEAKKLFLEK